MKLRVDSKINLTRDFSGGLFSKMATNCYFYIEKWTFKIMCEVCYRAKRDKKKAT